MERLDCDRMFVAVLDLGSFAAAARRLGTSSGQASKLVSRLEAELGVQLIKRTTRALAPTEVGAAYHQRVKALLDEFDTLDAAVRNASGTPAGTLRITAPMSFGSIQLTPALLDFARAYPGIHLDIGFTDRVIDLVEEGYDAAVRIGIPGDSSLIARKLCDMRVVLVAAPSYLAERGAPTRPQDLAEHDCIVDSNFRDPFNWRFCSPMGGTTDVAISGRLRFSSGEACLAAAAAGFGIANVPSFIAGPHIRAGHVSRLLVEAEAPPHGLFALYPPGRHLAAKVRVLVDFLVARFRGQPAWDQGW